MPELAFALLFLVTLMAVASWRNGLMLCTLIAILQDPMRKLTPDQPVYFVVMVGAVFGAAWIGALLERVPLRPNSIRGWRQQIGTPFALFVLLVLAQAAHSLVRFGSVPMTAIGLLAYFSPLPAIVFAYQYAVRFDLTGVTRWMWFYVMIATLSLSGIYLEYIDYDWAALGEVGEGLVVYDVGMILKPFSGFFRSSEIAAWHTATIACFVFLLLFGQRRSLPRLLLAIGLVAVLIALGTLTGRRKMLVQIIIFISSYFLLVAWFQRGAAKVAGFIGLSGLAGYVLIVGLVGPDPGDHSFDTHQMNIGSGSLYEAYALRRQSVIQDIPARFSDLGLAPISWAVNQYGWFGAGLGSGSQGTQHFVADDVMDRGAAEGGFGKLTLELGVPGLLLAAWMVLALGRYIWRVLAYLAVISPGHARFGYGLVAFLAANGAAFSVATQAFGDLFVLLTLGWTLGFLLALPVLAKRAIAPTCAAKAKRVAWGKP